MNAIIDLHNSKIIQLSLLIIAAAISGNSGLSGLSGIMGTGAVVPAADGLIKEDGDDLLLETDDRLLLE